MSLKDLAKKLYATFIKNKFPAAPCKVFLSASNMHERAIVRHAVDDKPENAWNAALNALNDALNRAGKIKPTILRADWVTSSQSVTWAEFVDTVKNTRRNFFRKGIALENYQIAFMEQELNANLILCNDALKSDNGEFVAAKADAYCMKRFGCKFPTLVDTDTIEIFETCAAFIEDGMSVPLMMSGKGDYSGRRDTVKGDGELFLKLARTGGNYLARQCNKNGLFTYGIYPCDNSIVPEYNALRHFSTLFAMTDVYSTYGKLGGMTLGKAISRGIDYGIKKFFRYRTLPDGQQAAYINDNGQLKLGSSGVALLTLTHWSKLQHTKKYLPLMNAIARGIFTMQKNNGCFVHSLNAGNYTVKDEFLTPFYDGEAVFGLMRLYDITKAADLLKSCERAFDYFIATEHWKNHDHWLSYAANELTVYKPERKYFMFGLKNCLPYLAYIRDRETNWATLLELIMATYQMLCRMKTLPETADILEHVDWNLLHEVLNYRAEKMLNGYFWSEAAMYFEKPEAIVGSFYVRQEKFRVRIDDVQHYLSGFIAYSEYLKDEQNKKFALAVKRTDEE